MKIGTKSVLFGVHAFWLHPWIVLYAWLLIHRRIPSLAELMAIFTHDLGYLRQPNMDGKEGSNHPEKAAAWWRGRFGQFGNKVAKIILGHSRFHAAANNIELSALFQPDKLATALYPMWLYLLLGNLSGEIKEYMDLRGSEKYPDYQKDAKTQAQWLIEIQGHMALMGIQGEKYYIVQRQIKEEAERQLKETRKQIKTQITYKQRNEIIKAVAEFLYCDDNRISKRYTNQRFIADQAGQLYSFHSSFRSRVDLLVCCIYDVFEKPQQDEIKFKGFL